MFAPALALGGCAPRVDTVAWMDQAAAGGEGGLGARGEQKPSDGGVGPDPTCDDGMLNGAELGVDCGGPDCDGCPCSADSADCDGDPTNGCETNLLASAANCGRCGHVCNAPNAASSCVDGACTITQCRGSYQNCSRNAAGGCDVNVDTDPLNCGACGNKCSTSHGAASCVGGACRITCASGFADCDGDPTTGCETSTDTSPNNCGACGKDCSSAFCVNGNCRMLQCGSGFGDCTGDGSCDVNLLDDASNCGRCGRVCSAEHGEAQCAGGDCALALCDAGWGDCDGQSDNGCETELDLPSNCGECGNVCPGAAPNCVSTDGGARCQAFVSYVNDAGDDTYDARLSIAHTLAAGANRLLLAAVVVEGINGTTFDEARPEAVQYGPVTMNPSGSQSSGQPGAYNPYIYYYYLTEPDLPSSSQTLTVTAPTNPAGVVAAELIECTGVDPVNPIELGTGGILSTGTYACAAIGSITTTEPGTALFVVAAADLAGEGTAGGAELMTPPVWDQGLIGSNGFYVYGALGGMDGSLVPGRYAVGFNYRWCNPAAVLPIGILPYHP